MDLYIAKTAGFCFGVKRSVDMSVALCETGPCVSLGMLIHNEDVIRWLEKKTKQNDVSAKISNMIYQNRDNSDALSDREKDVIVSLVQGMSNKEIADHLCISINTVITHRRNIARKLQIHSPAGLTIYAIVNHLVDISSVRL